MQEKTKLCSIEYINYSNTFFYIQSYFLSEKDKESKGKGINLRSVRKYFEYDVK